MYVLVFGTDRQFILSIFQFAFGDEVIAPWGKEKLPATVIRILKAGYCKAKFFDGYEHGPVSQSDLIKNTTTDQPSLPYTSKVTEQVTSPVTEHDTEQRPAPLQLV
jgi:hypothetical protein